MKNVHRLTDHNVFDSVYDTVDNHLLANWTRQYFILRPRGWFTDEINRELRKLYNATPTQE